eukprot:TRINITY_DN12734_c0_g1_i2.p1 TRINITY_DN12734_c0_g1~~TRINITY_DN12734_c0_g1_i2.p1  ORF type:complete len:318 (+),score=86.59 TRINITY_DN12734_c0_g1_i2:40-954(+)
MKDQHSTLENRINAINNEAKHIKVAQHVVVIGGGITGVELAAEIITRYPHKKVSIVHAHSSLLQTLSTSVQRAAHSFFQKNSVSLILNTRVSRCTWDKGIYMLETNAKINNYVEADKVYFCGGYIPNTEWLAESFLSNVLDNRGQIKVDATLQVEGTRNVWAVGDVATTGDAKTAYAAQEQAKYFLEQFFRNVPIGKPFSKYRPMGVPSPIALLSLGVNRGILAVGGKVVSTTMMAHTSKHFTEDKVIGDYGQNMKLFKNSDYQTWLRNEISSGNVDEEDGDADELAQVRLAMSSTLQSEDIFH